VKFPYKWFKKYIDIKLSPQNLAETLTMLGIEVENFSVASDGDVIFELELTSNRPDCANMVGIAREIGAAQNKKVRYPHFKISEGKDKIQKFVNVEIKDVEFCPRYAARLIRNVKVGPSPVWLKSNLEKVGLRSINNVVDVTNFVLMELGHPLHAFDYDTLSDNKLIIRRAKKGEKIISIDMVERKLSPEILVIADGIKPQAIAGIMGGNLSEVKDSTKNVLLESAYFNKRAIRRAAKKLNMMTEASYRFERGADPEGLIFALNRTAELIQKLAGGGISKGLIDLYARRIPSLTLELKINKLNSLLGAKINLTQARKILKNLEFKIKSSTKDKIKVQVPSFRGDIEREIDLIEEIARHYGYNKISTSFPLTTFAPVKVPATHLKLTKVKDVILGTLIKFGLQEVINYSFTNLDFLLKVNLDEEGLKKNFITINNPISQEQSIMRPTLLPGLLNTICWNFNRQIDKVKIFEAGNIFHANQGRKKFTEKMAVALAITGIKSNNSRGKDVYLDLFDLKGMIEELLETLGISSHRFKKASLPIFHPQNSSWIIINDRKIGWWGEINPIVMERLGLKGKVLGAEIITDELLPSVDLNKQFRPLPKFPSIKRDLSLLVPLEVTSIEITTLIKEEGEGLIEAIDLFDLYQGEQVPDGFRSLGYNLTYRLLSKTLTDERVNDLHKKISQLLANKLEVKIRGG